MAQRYYREKRNGAAIILGALLIAGLSATLTAGVCTDWFKNNPFDQTEKDPSSGIDTSIQENGVNLKLLATTTTPEGYVVKTFTFAVQPSNASDQTVKVEAKYKDDTDCESVLTVSVDNESKTVSVVNKGAFEKQIIVTVTSNANAEAKATITVDYVKKLLGIKSSVAKEELTGNYYYFGGNYAENNISDFSVSSMITPTYSVFTKDKTYTFAVKEVSVGGDEWICSSSEYDNYISTSHLWNYFETLLQQRIQSGGALLTADEIWNIESKAGWHSYLAYLSENHLNASNDNYVSFVFNATYYCVEDPSIEVKFNDGSDTYLFLSLDYDFSGKTVEVSGVTVETPNIEF